MPQIVPGGYQVLPEQLSSASKQYSKIAADFHSSATAVNQISVSGCDFTPEGGATIQIDEAVNSVASALREVMTQVRTNIDNAAQALAKASDLYGRTEQATTATFIPPKKPVVSGGAPVAPPPDAWHFRQPE